jgi:hypothetical protein
LIDSINDKQSTTNHGCGDRNRTCERAVNSRLPVPARDPPQSAQRESNPHFRHGKAAGCRYIMGAGTASIVKEHPPRGCGRSEHQVGLEPTLPHYECGVLAAGRPVLCQGTGIRDQGSDSFRMIDSDSCLLLTDS